MVTSKRFGLLILVGVEVAISACASDTGPPFDVTNAVTTALFSGTVVDVQGAPVAGARVTVNGVTRTTGSNGQYAVSVIQSTSGYHLDIRKDGFGPVTEFRLAGATSLTHQLQAGTTFTINPTVSNTLAHDQTGIRVVIPANSLRSNAGPPSGTVRFTIIPHSSDTMPGSFTARNANQQQVALVSVGAVTLQAVDSAGNTLGLVASASLQVTLPVPSSAGGIIPACVRSGTCRIAMWRFDPASVLWIEAPSLPLSLGVKSSMFTIRGTDTVISSADGLGSWNCDIELTSPACTIVQFIGLPQSCYNPFSSASPPGIKLTESEPMSSLPGKTKTAQIMENTPLLVLYNEQPNTNLDLVLTFPPGAPASCGTNLMIFSDPVEAAGFPTISATGAHMRLSTGAPWGGTGYPTSPVDGLPLSGTSPDLDPPPGGDGIPDNPCHSLVQIFGM